jgi:hypothetical protein
MRRAKDDASHRAAAQANKRDTDGQRQKTRRA